MAQIVVNSARTIRELGSVSGRLRDPKTALKRVGQYVIGIIQQSFDDEAEPTNHKPWKPLRDVTLALRTKGKGSGSPKILRDSGDLKKSIHQVITGKLSVMIGTNKVYGRMHQLGGITSPKSMIPNKRIPARPFLGIDKGGEREILAIIKRYIVENRT